MNDARVHDQGEGVRGGEADDGAESRLPDVGVQSAILRGTSSESKERGRICARFKHKVKG